MAAEAYLLRVALAVTASDRRMTFLQARKKPHRAAFRGVLFLLCAHRTVLWGGSQSFFIFISTLSNSFHFLPGYTIQVLPFALTSLRDGGDFVIFIVAPLRPDQFVIFIFLIRRPSFPI